MTVIQGKVEICGVNTARLPVLKSAETRALLERARGGDKTAREELISALPAYIRRGDAVLVKASNSMRFGEISEEIKKMR